MKYFNINVFFFFSLLLLLFTLKGNNYYIIASDDQQSRKNEDFNIFPFGRNFSPLSLFNISPMDLPWMDSMLDMLNEFVPEEMKDFSQKLNFNVTHPHNDVCKFLIQWENGIVVKDINVDVDKKKRLLIVKYSHHEISEDSDTKERAYFEEIISDACLLTDEAVAEGKAAFAVKHNHHDQGEDTQVQIWFPRDESYVEPKSEEGAENIKQYQQYTKSTSCVKKMRNGRCDEVTTKTVTTPNSHIRTSIALSTQKPTPKNEEVVLSNLPVENEYLSENESPVGTELTDSSTDYNNKEENKNILTKNVEMDSTDENADMHGVDVSSSVLHLKREEWKDEL